MRRAIPILFFAMIVFASLVSATEYTESTELNCAGGVCNYVKSMPRFVYEDNEWKRYEDARSLVDVWDCLLYTSPSPRDGLLSRMPSSA